MAPERSICKVFATLRELIFNVVSENTRGGYNYALNLAKMALCLYIHDFCRQYTCVLSFLHTQNSSCPRAYGNGDRKGCCADYLLPEVIYL